MVWKFGVCGGIIAKMLGKNNTEQETSMFTIYPFEEWN
jgi:hypothetical protein